MKETLEEAAERIYPEDEQWTDRHIFNLGAKWQQKNSNINALDFEIDFLKREIKVLKHQQERSYSEEDMVKFSSWILLQDITSRGEGNYVNTYGKIVTVKDLFEQFKNK